MNKVYIGLSASKNWYGRLIRKLTRSEVNHSFILFRNEEFCKRWFAIQIDERGVVIIKSSSLLKNKELLEGYECTSQDLWNSVTASFDTLGDKYDWLGIVGFLIKLMVLRLFRRDIDNPLSRKGELFCSEYVSGLLKSAGVSGFEDIQPSEVSPGLLRRTIRKNLGNDWKKVDLTTL